MSHWHDAGPTRWLLCADVATHDGLMVAAYQSPEPS